mmetsp:Transcript_27683/g.53817  ORF Transcript_27683/g.53817 Transcript_27683/m.53817 type:complete len:1255 (-) Transcript_27683:248-4012(-)
MLAPAKVKSAHASIYVTPRAVALFWLALGLTQVSPSTITIQTSSPTPSPTPSPTTRGKPLSFEVADVRTILNRGLGVSPNFVDYNEVTGMLYISWADGIIGRVNLRDILQDDSGSLPRQMEHVAGVNITGGCCNETACCAGRDGDLKSMVVAPEGLVMDSFNNVLYVSDNKIGHNIRKIDLTTNTSTVLAGAPSDWSASPRNGLVDGVGTNARFDNPLGIAGSGVEGGGIDTLYVCDKNNHVIRTINTTTGETKILAGKFDQPTEFTDASLQLNDGVGTTAGFKSPSGISYARGILFVGDRGNPVVRKIDVETGEVTTPFGQPDLLSPLRSVDGPFSSTLFTKPFGTTVDPRYDPPIIYFSDHSAYQIRSADFLTQQVQVVAGFPTRPGQVRDGIGSAVQFMKLQDVHAIVWQGEIILIATDDNPATGTVRMVRKLVTKAPTASPTGTALTDIFAIFPQINHEDYLSLWNLSERERFHTSYQRALSTWVNDEPQNLGAVLINGVVGDASSRTMIESQMKIPLQDDVKRLQSANPQEIFNPMNGYDNSTYGVPILEFDRKAIEGVSNQGSQVHVGMIVGVTIGGVVALLLAVALALWLRHYRSPPNSPYPKLGNMSIYSEEDVEEHEILGEGSFGTAIRVTLRRSKPEVAVLKVSKDDKGNDELKCELEAMNSVGEHPNLLQLKGLVTIRGRLCVLVEFCEKLSLDLLHKTEDMRNYSRFLDIAMDICGGLQHIHSKGFLHRDLACRNLLMKADGTVVIADYGLSRKVDVNEESYYMKNSKFPWAWTAPETLENKKFTRESDIWSLGVTIWEIATQGERPYSHLDLSVGSILELIKQAKATLFPPKDLSDINPFIETMMSLCLCYKPKERWSAERLVNLIASKRNEPAREGKRANVVIDIASRHPRSDGGGEHKVPPAHDDNDENYDGDDDTGYGEDNDNDNDSYHPSGKSSKWPPAIAVSTMKSRRSSSLHTRYLSGEIERGEPLHHRGSQPSSRRGSGYPSYPHPHPLSGDQHAQHRQHQQQRTFSEDPMTATGDEESSVASSVAQAHTLPPRTARLIGSVNGDRLSHQQRSSPTSGERKQQRNEREGGGGAEQGSRESAGTALSIASTTTRPWTANSSIQQHAQHPLYMDPIHNHQKVSTPRRIVNITIKSEGGSSSVRKGYTSAGKVRGADDSDSKNQTHDTPNTSENNYVAPPPPSRMLSATSLMPGRMRQTSVQDCNVRKRGVSVSLPNEFSVEEKISARALLGSEYIH